MVGLDFIGLDPPLSPNLTQPRLHAGLLPHISRFSFIDSASPLYFT